MDEIKEILHKLHNIREWSQKQQIYLGLSLTWLVIGLLTLTSQNRPSKISYLCLLIVYLICNLENILYP